jgi:hypothetical protein
METKPKLSVETPSGDKPKDAYGMVYILFFLMGLVHILPATFFVTANGVSVCATTDKKQNHRF